MATRLVRTSNIWDCGWNPLVWPFKWNLFSSTFTCCYLFSKQFELLSLRVKYERVTIQMKPLQQHFYGGVYFNGESN